MNHRAMQAAAILGMNLEHEHARIPSAPTPPLSTFQSPLTLLLGPSGCGKTTLLRQLAKEARANRATLITIDLAPEREQPPADRPLVDLFQAPVEIAMRTLARAGLAEGSCMVRPPSTLSAGQHFRLRLALAMHELQHAATTPRYLLIDEFAATLDTHTANSVALLLRRFINDSPGTRAIIATHREELLDALKPERVVRLGENESEERRAKSVEGDNTPRLPAPLYALRSTHSAFGFTISRGTLSDYHSLAHHHYRATKPATIIQVLTAHTSLTPSALRLTPFPPPPVLAAVLLISLPTLNASWRDRAWPARFNTGDKREDARRLNHPETGIRCISRVIVDPRFRALGLATQLVRAYLSNPLTTHTEALAAMAHASSFFERAGMTPIPTPIGESDARLNDLLEQFGIHQHELSTPSQTYARAAASIGHALLERELTRWSRATRSARTASRASHYSKAIFHAACRTLASRPIAFVATSSDARETGPRWLPSSPSPMSSWERVGVRALPPTSSTPSTPAPAPTSERIRPLFAHEMGNRNAASA